MLVTDTKIIQQKALKALIFFDSVCRKNNLTYSLAYGTLLGAKRHKGFIPWDDDIDVFMPREDVNKFIEIMKKSPDNIYKIKDIYDYKSFYAASILKLYDSSTTLLEFDNKYNCKYGIYIDIFPVDGVDSDKKVALNKFNKYHKLLKKYHFFRASFHKKRDLRKFFLPIISIFAKHSLKKIIKLLHSTPFNSSDKIIVYPFEFDFETAMFPRKYFDNLIEIEFENHSFLAFADAHDYLTQHYGDYMTPPPKELQKPHHKFKVYIDDPQE